MFNVKTVYRYWLLDYTSLNVKSIYFNRSSQFPQGGRRCR